MLDLLSPVKRQQNNDNGTPSVAEGCSGNGYQAFTATRSVSGQSCEVKQCKARLVAGWVTQALLGSCAHAGYHQYYNGVGSV